MKRAMLIASIAAVALIAAWIVWNRSRPIVPPHIPPMTVADELEIASRQATTRLGLKMFRLEVERFDQSALLVGGTPEQKEAIRLEVFARAARAREDARGVLSDKEIEEIFPESILTSAPD